VIRLFSFLVPKKDVDITLDIDGKMIPVEIPKEGGFRESMLEPQRSHPAVRVKNPVTVPLVKLALARSGDKGNSANVGIIARRPDYLPYIFTALTEERVADYMRHVLDPENGKVIRWDLPGINGLNFLLENSLGGGGISSLRVDPQGKAFAQQMLDFPVPVPEALAKEISQEEEHGRKVPIK
jgi:hypothetical protein